MRHSFRWIEALFLSSVLYLYVLFGIERTQFFQLIGVFTGLFGLYFWILLGMQKRDQELGADFAFKVLRAGVLLRILAIFSLPLLSDDYFRFIWDGTLLSQGVNPFAQLPEAYMQDPERAAELGLSASLYQRLNSPQYFTIYPPVNQLVFTISVWISDYTVEPAVIWMKLFLFAAEVVSLFTIRDLLKKFGLPAKYIAIYALNPLVIVELVGNLHFEALMICFLLLTVRAFMEKKWLWAAFAFALSISSKLLPLMFMPFLLRRLGFWKGLGFCALVGILCVLAFLPILDWETLLHLSESVGLYFQRFEFNASIYYIVRAVGYEWVGYNPNRTAGPILALLTLLGILLMALLERKRDWQSFTQQMLGALTIYLAFAAIVHPWYSTGLIALCAFSRFRYPLIWSALLPLSYHAYRATGFEENIWMVLAVYLLVYAWAGYEYFFTNNKARPSLIQ